MIYETKNAIPGVLEADTIQTWYQEKPEFGMKDVAGMDAIKARLLSAAELVESKASEASPVQALLLYGIGGTGKSFVANAFARECMDRGYQFIKLDASDILSQFIGTSETTIRAAFREAADNAPCVLCFEDVDAACPNRSRENVPRYEVSWAESFLNSFHELQDSGKQVIVLLLTNAPSRIDPELIANVQRLPVPMPGAETREIIIGNFLNGVSLEPGFTFHEIADGTEHYSFRDIRYLADAILFEMKEAPDGEQSVLTRDRFRKVQKSNPLPDRSRKYAEIAQFTETWG